MEVLTVGVTMEVAESLVDSIVGGCVGNEGELSSIEGINIDRELDRVTLVVVIWAPNTEWVVSFKLVGVFLGIGNNDNR